MMKMDKSQNEMVGKWTDHCRQNCIEEITTKPDSPWENPAYPNIGQLGYMVRNITREFNVPLKEHDWKHAVSM